MTEAESFVVPAGAVGLKSQITGSVFYLLTASESMNIVLTGASGKVLAEVKGLGGGLKLGPFKEQIAKWQVTTVSGAVGSAVIAVADDPIEYSVISGDVTVSNQANSNLGTYPDVVAVGGVVEALVVANAARRSVVVRADPANNAAGARIGDANVAAGRGLLLLPGEPTTLDTTAAVSMWANAGDKFSIVET